ncbi:MAG: TonB-dependent receptor [Candidatus Sericytochromatia bacterium]|nr:TonB-dependent receptor [Candidatus Sericytochromatia bacterium]
MRTMACLLASLILAVPAAWAQEAPATSAAPESEEFTLDDFLSGNVVSATKTAQTLREAPAIIEVITRRDIRERQYHSVAEAVRTVPGFAVLYDYANYNVGVRGINGGLRAGSRIIKVMINNQPIALRTDASNFLGPELIPMDMIKRIEIIRGPGSALYGADAYLGVINIVTRSGEDLSGGQATLTGTTFAKGGGGASLSLGQFGEAFGKTYDAAISGYLGYADRSGLGVADSSPLKSTFDGQSTSADLNRPKSAFGSLSYGDEQLGTFNFTGSFQQQSSSGKFLDWSIGQKLLDSQNQLNVDNLFLRGAYEKSLLDNLVLTVGSAYVRGGPNAGDRLDIGKQYYDQLRKSGYDGVDLNADLRYMFNERNSLSIGSDYSYTNQRVQSIYNYFKEPFGANKPGDELLEGSDLGIKPFSNVGLYAQGIYYPLEHLGLTGNIRFDNHNIYGNVLNYRGGVVYLWNTALTSKLLYGTSFKAPSSLQLFSAPIVTGDIIGNPDLKPEKAQTIESELSWSINKNLIVSANGYYTQVQDQVKFVRAGANSVASNLASSSTLGMEGSLRWQWEFLRGYLNGALQSTTSTGGQDSIFVSQDRRSELFPTAMLNTGIVAPLPWIPLDVYLEGRYIGAMKPSETNFVRNSGTDYEVPAAFLVDLGVSSRDLKLFGMPLRVAAKVTNLLDNRFIYPGFGGIDIPGERLAFNLSVSQQF